MQRTSESGLPLDHSSEDSKLTDFRLAERRGQLKEHPDRRIEYPQRDSGRSWVTRPSRGARRPARPAGGLSQPDPLCYVMRADAASSEARGVLRDVRGEYQPGER